jgi:hypothetical protein
LAKRRYDGSLAFCETETSCSARGLRRRDEAEALALSSTVTAAAGAGLVAAGALLLWRNQAQSAEPEATGVAGVRLRLDGATLGVDLDGQF